MNTTIAGKTVSTPLFAPTVFLDKATWFWRHGVQNDAILTSYDVLLKDQDLVGKPLSASLGFDGLIIVDSGGYGRSTQHDPLSVHEVQKGFQADVGVILDHVAYPSYSRLDQQRMVDATIRNARKVVEKAGQTMALEGVIQGAIPEQRRQCAEALAALELSVYAVPLSRLSKYRQYAAAVAQVREAQDVLGPDAVIHAMGCGSRSLIAILSSLGVRLFDSSSYFLLAARNELYSPVDVCVLDPCPDRPNCPLCDTQEPPAATRAARAAYNLREIQKEIARVCRARELDVLPDYLERRLSSAAWDALKKA